MRYSKLILAALAAIALLAMAVSNAAARNLSVSEKNFEIIWNNALTGKAKLSFTTPGVSRRTISCNVTLLGGFVENTINKRTEVSQGSIRHGEVESCVNGGLTINAETLPWEVRYGGFTGTLPRITTITTNLIRSSFRVRESGGLVCEAATEPSNPGVGTIEEINETTGEVESLTESGSIPLVGGICPFPSPATFSGKALVRNLPGNAKITVTLIGEVSPSVTPSPIAFGTLEVESLARRTVTLTAGSEALTVRRISVRAGNYFAITDPNRCVGARIEARRSCAFRVLFSAPGESGRRFSDTVTVETSVETIEARVTAET